MASKRAGRMETPPLSAVCLSILLINSKPLLDEQNQSGFSLRKSLP